MPRLDNELRNFDITIRGVGPPYSVTAEYGEKQAEGAFTYDANQAEWQQYLQLLGNIQGKLTQEKLILIGTQLFNGVFQGDIYHLWNSVYYEFRNNGLVRLRIRLFLRPAAISALPWECLYDPKHNFFLATSAHTPLVRVENLRTYIGTQRPLRTKLPLKILLVAPEDPLGKIDTEQEVNNLQQIFGAMPSESLQLLDPLLGRVDVDEFDQAARQGRADIVHIITHGEPNSLLFWHKNEPSVTSAAALKATIERAPTVKLVFLNVCLAGQDSAGAHFSSVATQLLQVGVPAVIAMQFRILDQIAIEFSKFVCQELLAENNQGGIDLAVNYARGRLFSQYGELAHFFVPILWLNARDGIIICTETFTTSGNFRTQHNLAPTFEFQDWLTLWPKNRPTEAEPVRWWFQEIGLEDNPFGPEQAMLDSYLPESYDLPQSLENIIRGARSTLLYGEPGSGKTAAALLLANDCRIPLGSPRESATFPIYQHLSVEQVVQAAHLQPYQFLLTVIGEELIRFYALHPQSFLAEKADVQSCMLVCMAYAAGNQAQIWRRLHQAGLPSTEIEGKLQEIIKQMKPIVSTPMFLEKTWQQILTRTHPFAFVNTYLLVDIHTHDLATGYVNMIAQYVQRFMNLAAILATANIYLKLFLPDRLQPLLTIPPDMTQGTIRWSNYELRNLLIRRIHRMGYTDFNQLFDTQSRLHDPTERLIEAARGIPRRLITLGNHLLRQHAAQQADQIELSYLKLESILVTAQ